MRRIKILIPLLLFGMFAHAQGFPNTDSLKRYIDRYINNSAVNAFQNLRLNTALEGLVGQIDSVSSTITGGVRVVDTLYSLNDTTLVFKIKGTSYQIPVARGVGEILVPGYSIIKAGLLLKVDTTQLFNDAKFTRRFVIPSDTFTVAAKDTGALAWKTRCLYVYSNGRWRKLMCDTSTFAIFR